MSSLTSARAELLAQTAQEAKGTRQGRVVNLAAKLTTKSQGMAGAQRVSSWLTGINNC